MKDADMMPFVRQVRRCLLQLARVVGLCLPSIVPICPIAALAAEPPLVLQLTERPPYVIADPGGAASGISAVQALRAFKKAGIPYELRFMSAKRQIVNLQSNEEPLCSLAWYKTPEREAFAKFTKAISQDTMTIGLANAKFHVAPDATVDSVLANPATRVLLKESVVYGAYIESKLATMKAQLIRTYDEYELVTKAIMNDRADLTFATVDEAKYYVEQAGYPLSAFNIIHFPDMPPGERRYIMCSKKVSDELIDKINAALP